MSTQLTPEALQLGHGFPFTLRLAAGDEPTRILSSGGRVVFTVDPLFEEAAECVCWQMNAQADAIRKANPETFGVEA